MKAFSEALRKLGALPEGAEDRLRTYADQVRFYNKKLNLVANGEEDYLLAHHVAHCIRLGQRRFAPHTTVVDWGTGGGMPLIPLAILFPETTFVGVDAVEKKVLAVRHMARSIGLSNVEAIAGRAEKQRIPHVYSVSRATAPLADLWGWHVQGHQWCPTENDAWPPGLICLKGGELAGEEALLLSQASVQVDKEEVGYKDPYYQAKKVIVVTALEPEEAAAEHG